MVDGQTFDVHIFSFLSAGNTTWAEQVTGKLSFQTSPADERFVEAHLSQLSNGTTNLSDRRKLCAWSGKWLLTCTEYNKATNSSLLSVEAFARAAADLYAFLQAGSQTVLEDDPEEAEAVLGKVYGLADINGDFTSFLKVTDLQPGSCVPASFELSPPGRGSFLRDSRFTARLDVGIAQVSGTPMPEPEIFPSITDQTFDIDLTLFFRYPDFEDAFEADVVNVSGSLTFSNQVNYENSPDPNGRFVIATYSGLTASPAILEIPSTFREICAYTSDKKSLVCSRLVDASLDDRDMGSFGPYAFTETFAFVFETVSGFFAFHFDDANAFVEALVRFGIAEAEAEAFADVYFGDNGAESGALATAIALVEGLRAATDKNRRFTDLIRLEQVECREFLDWTTCVPSLLRFANPGRGSFLGKVEQEGEEEAKEALDAVAVGSAVRQGCHLPELTPSVAMPASCSCAAGEFPSFLDSGSFSLTLTEFHRFEFPGALNATNATVEQKNVEVQVKSQKNEQGLPQSTGRFVLLRLADEQNSAAVCAYARDQSSLVCARSSLLLQSVEVNAMISLSKFIEVSHADASRGPSLQSQAYAEAYAAADAFSVLGLDSNAEFTMELSVSDCIPNTCAVKAVELLPAGRGTLLNYVQIVNETTNEVSPVGVSQAVVALGNMTGDSS